MTPRRRFGLFVGMSKSNSVVAPNESWIRIFGIAGRDDDDDFSGADIFVLSVLGERSDCVDV